MATLKTTSSLKPSIDYSLSLNHDSLWTKYIKFADMQKSQHIIWWLVSLLLHCLLVPFIFLLSVALNGPTTLVLGASMVLFFINVVANMSGASTRLTILAFFGSLVLHIVMAGALLI